MFLVTGSNLTHRSDGYPGTLLELAFLRTNLTPSHTNPFGVGFPFGITLGSKTSNFGFLLVSSELLGFDFDDEGPSPPWSSASTTLSALIWSSVGSVGGWAFMLSVPCRRKDWSVSCRSSIILSRSSADMRPDGGGGSSGGGMSSPPSSSVGSYCSSSLSSGLPWMLRRKSRSESMTGKVLARGNTKSPSGNAILLVLSTVTLFSLISRPGLQVWQLDTLLSTHVLPECCIPGTLLQWMSAQALLG